jgi:fumarylacetoacetase
MTDATHDAGLKSWVASANDGTTDFPIQNLPFGRFRRPGGPWRLGVAIGDQVLDLRAAIAIGLPLDETLNLETLNAYMALPLAVHRKTRARLSEALSAESDYEDRLRAALVPQSQIECGVPCRIADYTDFYAGIHHATRVGKLLRPDNPLLPNYKWVPIGYHGRASSIVASGRGFHRPRGQVKGAGDAAPRLEPSARLDYELELGIFVARPNRLGEPIPIAQAESHVFGVALLNDWSARDIQAWEYQPLGPFLSKSFATTVSPWIVTLDALEPFRQAHVRAQGDPEPLPYLDSEANRTAGAIDITLEVWLQTKAMRDAGVPAQRLTHSSFTDAYWTLAQLVAHHTVNGCNLQCGGPAGLGDALRTRLRAGGLAPRVDRGWRSAGASCRWRNAHLPRGPGYRHPARLLRTPRFSAHRVRAVRGDRHARENELVTRRAACAARVLLVILRRRGVR